MSHLTLALADAPLASPASPPPPAHFPAAQPRPILAHSTLATHLSFVVSEEKVWRLLCLQRPIKLDREHTELGAHDGRILPPCALHAHDLIHESVHRLRHRRLRGDHLQELANGVTGPDLRWCGAGADGVPSQAAPARTAQRKRIESSPHSCSAIKARALRHARASHASRHASSAHLVAYAPAQGKDGNVLA